MNQRLLLIKIITLLYLETLLSGAENKSVDLVDNILKDIKIPDADIGLISSEADIIGALLKICNKLKDATKVDIIEKADLLQQVRLIASSDNDIFESLKEGIDKEYTEEHLLIRTKKIRYELKEYYYLEQNKKKIFEVANTLRFKENQIEDVNSYLREFISNLDSSIGGSTKKDKAILNEVNFSNLESVEKLATSVKEELNGDGKLKFHLQDLNDMLNGGIRRGEFMCTSALPHHNKTGFSLDMFAGIAMNNKPFLYNTNKKPLLLRISFEDDIELNFNHLYKHLFEWEFNEPAIMKDKTPKEISEYVMNKLTATGFEVILIKVDPSLWTIFDMFAYIRELESNGYELVLCMLDYLRKMPTTGCIQGVAGFDVRDMARRTRNFFNSRRCAFVSPHQVSTQAKEIQRNIPKDFVKMLPGGGFYDGCKSLDAEIDIELFQHIEKHNGHSYLTLHRGKHRGAPIISEEKKYLVYKFHDVGGIPPDIGKERSGLKKVGGKPGSEADQDFNW